MLTTIPEHLPDDIDALKGIITNLITHDIKKLEKEYQFKITLLEEKVAWLNSRLFGRKSEKLSADELLQMRMFDEAEAGAAEEAATQPEKETTVSVSSHSRKKAVRKPLPEWLPRIDVVHDLTPEEKVLPDGKALKKIGEVVSEKLDIIPPKFQVIRNIRYKYARPEVEIVDTENDEEEKPGVVTAPLPPQIIEKGIASAGLVAYIITAKFCDALPYYRQTKIFSRADIDLPRATMCSWPIMIHREYGDFFNLMREELLSCPVIGIDETVVQVMNEPGRKNTDQSYMWVFRGHGTDKPVIWFEYHPTRSAQIALAHLKNYEGYIQSDGLATYDVELGKNLRVVHAGCWSHTRRKFYEAAKNTDAASNANAALGFIGQLYKIEDEARNKKLSPEEIKQLREKEAAPVLDSFRAWLDDRVHHVAPKSLLGKAILYALNEWTKLRVYLQDGHIPIDNNLVENAIRPFVIGRKNWLFSGSPDGARASAAFYSLIETAKACGHEPYWYLRHLFEQLPLAKTRDKMRLLLPMYLDPSEISRKV
jgi:transposase